MFVRFRQAGHRLQASLIETRRITEQKFLRGAALLFDGVCFVCGAGPYDLPPHIEWH
jgi:hypothetical protein